LTKASSDKLFEPIVDTETTPDSVATQPLPETPFVSIVMPVFNEERFIAHALGQVLAQDYPPDRVEILVADGMSTDKTREIVHDFERRHPQVRLIDNPARFRACGLNAGILQSKGDVVICIDGHCQVASDFVRQDIALLEEHPDAWCVGGPVVHVGNSTVGRAVAFTMSHPAGVGSATHRFAGFEGYAEGAPFPAFRRWVFDRVGMFDEKMVRTEDDEHNFRIKQAGGRVFVSPRVRYEYYVRDTFSKLYQQYNQYGFWRIPVMRKHKRPTTLRQVIPPLFFLTMFVLLVAGVVLKQPLLAVALPALYVGVLLLVAASSIPKIGLASACLVAPALFTMHAAYAWGILYGFIAVVFKPSAFDSGGSMSQQKR
jgi:glycosyltransferase involved in cell wall biosynthesis